MFFWPKIRFFPKKHPKYPKRLIFTLEKGTFFLWTIFSKSLPQLAQRLCEQYKAKCINKRSERASLMLSCHSSIWLVLSEMKLLYKTLTYDYERTFFQLPPFCSLSISATCSLGDPRVTWMGWEAVSSASSVFFHQWAVQFCNQIYTDDIGHLNLI